MKKTMWDIEIKMMIPFDVLATYPNDDVDEYDIEPTFMKIMKLLNIELNVRRIIETLYSCRSGKSAIEVHYSLHSFEEFILLNTYMDETDQLDFIYIMFRSKASKGGELRNLTHKFYTDTCKYNVYYEEGLNVIKNSTKIDFTKPDKLSSNDIENILQDKKLILFRKHKILKEFSNEV